MVLCNECGSPLGDGATVCEQCGASENGLTAATPPLAAQTGQSAGSTSDTGGGTPPARKRTVSLGWILLFIGLIVSVVLIAVLRPRLATNQPAAAVTTEISPSPLPAGTSTPTPRKKRIQVTLKAGQSSEPFIFQKNGDVMISGNMIGRCKSDNQYELAEVYISGPSNVKDYYYVLCLMSEQGGISGHVVSGETSTAVSSGFIPANWSVGTWVSWAPEDQYALTYATGEVTMGDMVLIDLSGGKSGALTFRRVAAPDSTDGSQPEVQNIIEKTLRWLDAHTFTVRLEVTCNPYDLVDCDPNRVLRRYKVTVDLATGSQRYDQL